MLRNQADITTPGYTPPQATNLLYTGEQFDTHAQMYYNRARYYNPSNGLFNRVDPYAGNMQDPQSLHKYLYVHNNPVNMLDPTGMFGVVGCSMGYVMASVLHGIYDGVVTTIGTAMELSIYGLQNGLSMKAVLITFLAVAVLAPLLIMGAVGGVGKLFGPTAGKWAGRFFEIASLFPLMFQASGAENHIPQLADGQNNGGRSQLRSGMLSYASSGDMSNVRAHHIIACEFKDHPVIKEINMDINHASNGIFLSKEQHTGSHYDYRRAMRDRLNHIETLPRSQWMPEVVKLRNNSAIALYHGAPLVQKHGATFRSWRNIFRGRR